MAINVFLGSNGDNFTVANNNVNVKGFAGTQNVTISSGVTGTTTNADVERIDVAGNLSTYTFKYDAAAGGFVAMSGTTVVLTVPSVNGTTNVVFADGSAALVQTATGFTLGGQTVAVGTTAAAITSTAMGTSFNTAVTSGSSTMPSTGGQSFALTTSAEVKALTAGNDTVDGSSTVDTISGDTIIDTSSTDSDVANIKISSNPGTKPVISGVETINLDLGGFGLTFDASSVSGGQIVATSSTPGVSAGTIDTLNGSSAVSVKAAGSITTLTVDNISNNANITAGTATTLNINGTTDATDATTINVSGNTLALASGGARELKTLNITGSGSASTVTLGTSVVELSSNSSVVLKGDQSLTLKASSADLTGITVTDSTTAGTTTANITATADGNDLSKVGTDVVQISAVTTTADTLTFANNVALKLAQDSTANVLDIKSATASGTANITLVGDASITDDNTTYYTTVNVTAADTNVPAAGTAFKAILNSDVTLNLSGATSVVLDAASVASAVNATGLTAKLTASVVSAKVTNLTAGTADDTITIGTSATAFTVEGGAGNDTLVGGVADIASVTATNFEILDMNNVSVTASKDTMFSGKNMVIKSTGSTTGTIDIDSISTSVIDLSGITIDTTTMKSTATNYAVTLDMNAQTLGLTLKGSTGNDSIEGGSNADYISGGNGHDNLEGNAGADTIIAGEGTDLIIGGAGNDTISLTETTSAVDTVTLATGSKDTITGFTSAKDLIDLSGFVASTTETNIASATAAATETLDAANYYFITGNGTAGSLTTGGVKTLAAADYTATTLTNVAAYLGEHFTVASATGAADKAVFVLNDTVSGNAYIYLFTEDAGPTAGILAAELELVGIANATTIVSGDVI